MRVRLNKSESYLYTEYQLRVERWIHPGGGPPSVTLLTGGGRVFVGGALTETLPGLSRETGTHLFVLSQVPRSTAFILKGPLLTQGPSWLDPLRYDFLPNELNGNRMTFDQFVEDLTLARSSCS